MNVICKMWGHQPDGEHIDESVPVPYEQLYRNGWTLGQILDAAFDRPRYIRRFWQTSCKRCHRSFGVIHEGEMIPDALIRIPNFRMAMRHVRCQIFGHADEMQFTYLQYRCNCGSWGRTKLEMYS